MPHTIVCFGDSLTRGQVSANFVDLLAGRFADRGLFFINEGIDGDLSYNLVRRLPATPPLPMLAATILIGTNDINASLALGLFLIVRLGKWIYSRPNLAIYEQNLLQMIEDLKARQTPHILLASIPPLGEDLESKANKRVQRYNEVVRRVAAEQGTHYVPVYEALSAELKRLRPAGGRPYRGELMNTARLVYQRNYQKMAFNEIGTSNGFVLLADGIHLNERGAEIVAGLFETVLNSILDQEPRAELHSN